MASLMKKGEFAAHMKVGASAVSNWKKRGLLVFATDPATGRELVDVEKSELLVRGTVDQTQGRPRAADRVADDEPGPVTSSARSSDPSGLEALRMDDLRERTTSRRIENAKAAGQLVQLSEYERRAGDMGRTIRERTQGLIRQNAERLAAETDPRKVQSFLMDQFDALFAQVADEIEASASEEIAADVVLASVEAAADADLEATDAAEAA